MHLQFLTNYFDMQRGIRITIIFFRQILVATLLFKKKTRIRYKL